MSTVITYPVPAYSNPTIQPQFYQPSVFTISNVVLGQTTTVTATSVMNYVIGQLVRLIIPPTFGCRQLNEAEGYVISLPTASSVNIDINSSIGVDPYVSSSGITPAQIMAIGDINTGIISSTGRLVPTTNIPGAFINISPL